MIYSTVGGSSIKRTFGLRSGNLQEYLVRDKKRKHQTK